MQPKKFPLALFHFSFLHPRGAFNWLAWCSLLPPAAPATYARRSMAHTVLHTPFLVVYLFFPLSSSFSEFFFAHNFLFSIGHVLCSNCCLTIVEKTSPRSSPACPFCREPFTSDDCRLIRMDFTTSGWSTPRRFPAMESFNDAFSTEVLQKKTERLLSSVGSSKARPEVRRLEEKVARVAAKKCSVEEVSSLYTELDTWLRSEKDDQVRPPIKKKISSVTASDKYSSLTGFFPFPQRSIVASYPHEPFCPLRGQ